MQPTKTGSHKPGALKQQNKAHKHGRHRSKSALSNENKGKFSVKSLSKFNKRELSKMGRRNKTVQVRQIKREETLAKKRKLGSQSSPPFLVAVIPLSPTLDPENLMNLLRKCDEDLKITESKTGNIHISMKRFKQRFMFVLPSMDNYNSFLDTIKVVDTVLLLHSMEDDDEDAEGILSVLFAQGLPSTVHVAHGLSEVPIKKRNNVKKAAQKNLEKKFPGEKLNIVETSSDALLIIRQIGNQKQRSVMQRDIRSHMLAEEVEFVPDEGNEFQGTLKVSGYVRSQILDVNGLVHIPGAGDFQMSAIYSTKDPHPLHFNSSNEEDMDDDTLLARADPSLQTSLESQNTVDPMEGEQTWPTEEEIMESQKETQEKKRTRRLPKGTSKYQAAWILDSDSEEGEDPEDEEEDVEMNGMEYEDEDDESNSEKSEEEYDTVTVNENGDLENYDENMNEDEESRMLEKFRLERLDRMFPDEIDTPVDQTARVRFQKYRGLKSFKNTYWDPKENLPSDYSRIFQFEHLNRTRKRILNEERDGALPGWYVTVHISAFPKNLYENRKPGTPLPVIGLLPHEHKMSVLNVAVKRYCYFDKPLKAKESLIFHVGCRRFRSSPIFSSHTNGAKHKFERYLPEKGSVVATVYAPITFSPASVLVFKEESNGSHSLVATGISLSVNPDRIIAKRAVLSGHSFKINKKTAVIRYMFFNPEDIKWFKPVELRTKYGRRGHIKETLGTHGHMKCVFDGSLKSEDTVLMNLYKRIFPKWSYDPYVPEPANDAVEMEN